MPWLPDQSQPADLTDLPLARKEPPANPTTGEIWSASFRQLNIIGSTIQDIPLSAARSDEIEPDLNPFEYAKGTIAELEPSFLARARNRREIDAYIDQRKQEDADRRTRMAGGWMGVLADLAANALDPTILIPAGGLVRSGKVGYNIAKSVAVGAASAAAGVAVQEALLQSTQLSRPIEQSTIAVGGAALLGGIIGAAGAKMMTNVEYNSIAARLAKEVADGAELPQDVAERLMKDYVAEIRANPAAAGAASVAVDSLDDLSIAGKAAQFAAKPVAWMNPILRALHNPDEVVRRFALDLMENPIYLKKNIETAIDGMAVGGRPSEQAIETIVKQYHGAYTIALEDTEKVFVDARKAGVQIRPDDFRDQIGRALRRGGVAEDGNEHVTKAAGIWRDRVLTPMLKRGQEAGLFPSDIPVEKAAQYFTRMYNVQKIEAKEGDFRKILYEGIAGVVDNYGQKEIKTVTRRAENLRREADDLEYGILRRSTSQQARDAGEVVADAETEKAILDALKLVRAGTKVPEPEGLTVFLHRNGGLYDGEKELEALGISSKTRPGFIKSSRRTAQNQKGGISLDDAALKAWEDGFFPDHMERPSVREFIDALAGDFSKSDRVVRGVDREAADQADLISRIVSDLERMGVDVKSKAPMFSTSEDIKGLVGRITAALDKDAADKAARLKAKAAEIERELGSIPRNTGDALSRAEFDTYVKEIVDEVFDKITGRSSGVAMPIGFIPQIKRGFAKGRTLPIPDLFVTKEGLKFEDFLVDDVEHVMNRYVRTVGSQIELVDKYGRIDMADQFDEIRKSFADKRARLDMMNWASEGEKKKAIDALKKAETDGVRDLDAAREMLLGIYGADQNSTNFAKMTRIAGAFNSMRAMGGVVLASVTDLARPIFVHGLGDYMKDGIAPLVSNLKGVKLSAREAKLAGVVGDIANQARLATMAEITDPYMIASPFERLVDNTSKGFWRLTGMPYWNDFVKSFSSVMTQNRILRIVADPAKAGKRDREYANFLGIGDGVIAKRIAEQFATHGEMVKGVAVAHTDDWTDIIAKRTYLAAVAKDVDSIIVAKGIGDIPLALRTPVGRALSQFRGFALASYQRATLRGLQEDRLNLLAGMIASTSIGMFVYWLKSVESNRASDISDNLGRWIAEGLDRSGMLAVPFEINNTIEKIGAPGIYTGLQALFPHASQKQPASRYAVRNVADSLAGPSVGLVKDILQLAGAAARADLTKSDVTAMRRLTPGASLPFIRSIVEYGVMPKAREAVQ